MPCMIVLSRIKKVIEFAKECQKLDINYNLVLALASKNYRKNKRHEYLIKYRKNKGYFLSKNSPIYLFGEVLVQKIYDIEGFKPKKTM
jgi:hypothetical protein